MTKKQKDEFLCLYDETSHNRGARDCIEFYHFEDGDLGIGAEDELGRVQIYLNPEQIKELKRFL